MYWLAKFFNWIDKLIVELYPRPNYDTPVADLPMNQLEEKPVVPPPPKYLWDTPEEARHSCRLIADEEGLTVDQKNLMSQVIHCESGYRIGAINENKKDGKTWSVDRGICQWNDYFHSKEISPGEALHDPEKSVRLMCKYVKAGQISQWSCHKLGLYKNYSA